MTGCNDHHYSR